MKLDMTKTKVNVNRIARYRKAYPNNSFLTDKEILFGLNEERAKKREVNNYIKKQIIKNS